MSQRDVLDNGLADITDNDCAGLFLQRKATKDWNHTGFAFAAEGSGSDLSFSTIEGNTNPGGDRNGGEARRSLRSMKGDYDFIVFR